MIEWAILERKLRLDPLNGKTPSLPSSDDRRTTKKFIPPLIFPNSIIPTRKKSESDFSERLHSEQGSIEQTEALTDRPKKRNKKHQAEYYLEQEAKIHTYFSPYSVSAELDKNTKKFAKTAIRDRLEMSKRLLKAAERMKEVIETKTSISKEKSAHSEDGSQREGVGGETQKTSEGKTSARFEKADRLEDENNTSLKQEIPTSHEKMSVFLQAKRKKTGKSMQFSTAESWNLPSKMQDNRKLLYNYYRGGRESFQDSLNFLMDKDARKLDQTQKRIENLEMSLKQKIKYMNELTFEKLEREKKLALFQELLSQIDMQSNNNNLEARLKQINFEAKVIKKEMDSQENETQKLLFMMHSRKRDLVTLGKHFLTHHWLLKKLEEYMTKEGEGLFSIVRKLEKYKVDLEIMNTKGTFNRIAHSNFYEDQFKVQVRYDDIQKQVEKIIEENESQKQKRLEEKKIKHEQRLENILSERNVIAETVKEYKEQHEILNENFMIFRKKMPYLYSHSNMVDYFQAMKNKRLAMIKEADELSSAIENEKLTIVNLLMKKDSLVSKGKLSKYEIYGIFPSPSNFQVDDSQGLLSEPELENKKERENFKASLLKEQILEIKKLVAIVCKSVQNIQRATLLRKQEDGKSINTEITIKNMGKELKVLLDLIVPQSESQK